MKAINYGDDIETQGGSKHMREGDTGRRSII